MGYQFIHVEAYSRQAGKQKKGGLNVRQVIAETGREPGNCPHVPEPQPPEILYGSLQKAEQTAVEWAEQATDVTGRKLRKDGHCLLAGVISLPRLEEENFPVFAKRSTAFLIDKYGDRLQCVVAHEKDEEHPHLHFYVVPRPGEKFEAIHEGQKAAKQAKAEGKVKGEQNAAYIAGMRIFQDDFSKKVGTSLGLTRLGPGRRRLTRAAWKAEQKQAEFFANSKAVAQKGYRAGFKKGHKKALLETQKMGEKLGGVLAGVLGGFHKPTANAIEELQQLKRQIEKQEKKHTEEKKQAESKARNQVNSTLLELQKYKNIATNTEAENKRLSAEIEALNGYKKDSTNSKLKLT